MLSDIKYFLDTAFRHSNHNVTESQQEKSKEDITETPVNHATAEDNITAMDRDYDYKTIKSSATKCIPL